MIQMGVVGLLIGVGIGCLIIGVKIQPPGVEGVAQSCADGDGGSAMWRPRFIEVGNGAP